MIGKILRVSAALLLSFGALYAQEDHGKVQIKVTHVSGSVYMLEGDAGNIGASIGEDGIVLVDDQVAPLAGMIRSALKGISDKPIRFIINTHYHDDHTGGNAAFQKDATIIAQDNLRKRLEEGSKVGNLGGISMDNAPQPKEALPIVTFDHDLTVHLNGEDIHAVHFPHGHTDGDSVVFFPKAHVVHLGDDFVTYGFPFVDLAAGGSVEGMIAALEDVVAKLPSDAKVIPGHGPISTLDDVRRYVTMMKDTKAVVEKGIQKGKTLDQMKQEKVLGAWQKWSGDFVSTDEWIATLYNDIVGKKGEFLKNN